MSLRWTVERGLIAAANIVFDTADHILSGQFGVYPDTYEDSLSLLREREVISNDLYTMLKGLGGFRNILVHEYVAIDMGLLSANFRKAMDVLPAYSQEIRHWLATLD